MTELETEETTTEADANEEVTTEEGEEVATEASDETTGETSEVTEESTGEEESTETSSDTNTVSTDTNTVSGETSSSSTNEIDLSVTSTSTGELVNGEEISKKDVSNTTNTADIDSTNTTANTTAENTNTVSNTTTSTNTVEEDDYITTDTEDAESTNTVADTTNTTDTADTTTAETTTEEELIDEEAVVNEQIEAETENTDTSSSSSAISASITDTNVITVSSVTKATTLYLRLKYTSGEVLDVNSLYTDISAEFVGTYIDGNLNEVTISSNTVITVGWTYTNDIQVSSKYSKVAPFEVSETSGTIVESRITVSRNIEDENYLPLKSTTLEIEVPNINGKQPTELDVSATRLMATRGEEIGETELTSDNWSYNAETGILTITVENTDAIYTYGDDTYVITYRYEDYVSENEISLQTNGKVTVEEYSGESNNTIEKTIADEQTVTVLVGDLITYSIGTTDDTINKGKINANYNSEEAVYETEFTSTITMNILTNDIVSEFTIKDTKEYYVDNQNIEFETTDVKYKQISFKYSEIAEMLEEGATIEVKSNSGELLYTLNSDLIKSQDQCVLGINGDLTGIEISVKNLSVNGTITVELLKSIGKCSYDKSAFANFEKLESRVKAEVKYIDSDEAIELSQIKATKYFEKSETKAQVSLSQDTLSTLSLNEDVEVKIELYNDVETSDLYVNPVFEIVFPSYVKNVNAKMVNLMYEDELTVKSADIYTNENGLITMRIALEGTETHFSTGTLTNGTNIIINTDIEVDPYAPKTNDELRMYYYNEGVTNYESQTKWTVGTSIPEGILKTTNGFDADVFSYNAPSGFVTANGISNYSDDGSEVVSIDQGEETVQIEMNQSFKVATMTLTAMNNTGNDCMDVVLMGRIPVQGATDVVTNETLSTNIDTTLTSIIYSSDKNAVAGTVYYSSNANATKDLKLESNGWTTEPENIREMKSYMIVLDGTVDAGTVLQYTYSFEIPENLPYESEIYGNFGAFYNNITSIAVVYESSDADMVGLVTEEGPHVEATLAVSIGDGEEIEENKILRYTVTIENTGSTTLENIEVSAPVPDYAYLYEYSDETNSLGAGEVSSETTYTTTIESLEPDETYTVNYAFKASKLPTVDEYYAKLGYTTGTDEDGYYIMGEDQVKEYVDEKLPESIYISSYATVSIPSMEETITTNTVKNKLIEATLSIDLSTMNDQTELNTGDEFAYLIISKNELGEEMTNVEITLPLPDEVDYVRSLVSLPYHTEDEGYTVTYSEEEHTVTYSIDTVYEEEAVNIYTYVNVISGGESVGANAKITYGSKSATSDTLQLKFYGIKLAMTQSCSVSTGQVYEGNSLTFTIAVENTGTQAATNIIITDELSENLENVEASYETYMGKIIIDSGVMTATINSLESGETAYLNISGTAATLNGSSKEITNQAVLTNELSKDLYTDVKTITIISNPDLVTTESESTGSSEEEIVVVSESSDSSTTDTSSDSSSTSDSSSSSSSTSDSDDSSSSSSESTTTTTSTYSISGIVWLDEDKDGARANESGISTVKVSLQQNGSTIKATTTDGTGTYKFTGLEAGTYIVSFEYDSDTYTATTYKKQGVDDSLNSDAVQSSAGYAVTDAVTISENSVQLDLGLQKLDTFDLVTYKYLTKATVTSNGETKTYEYDDVDLAKIEIKSKYLNSTDITFEYKIVVENVGDIAGTAQTILDYLPEELTFDEEENTEWAVGDDGILYNKSLKDTTISAGESKDLTLVLHMAVTEDNTGTISNKIVLADLSSGEGTTENSDNNSSTQEVIVSVSTGGTTATIIFITILVVAILTGIGYKNGKIKLSKINLNKNFKRIYK